MVRSIISAGPGRENLLTAGVSGESLADGREIERSKSSYCLLESGEIGNNRTGGFGNGMQKG